MDDREQLVVEPHPTTRNNARMTREEMISAVRRIMMVEGTDDEFEAWMLQMEDELPNSHGDDLIFHHRPELTAKQHVDEAIRRANTPRVVLPTK